MERGLFVLTLLYFYQGLIIGLAAGGIQVLYAHDNRIGLFSFCLMSFSMKFIWSPLLDYYFIPQIGKRKTYIIPLHILTGLLLLTVSFQDITDVQILFYFYFLIMLSIATSDTAIDGWQVTLLDHVENGSICQTFGQSTGWFLSEYMFIYLNQNGLLDLSSYFRILGCFGIFLGFFVIIIKETNPEEVVELKSFIDTLKEVKGFYRNPHLRKFCIILLTMRCGLGSMDILASIYLVRNGLPKLTLSKIGLINFCLTFWIPLVTGYYLTGKKKELKIVVQCIIYATINLFFFIVSFRQFLNYGPQDWIVCVMWFHLLVNEVLKKIWFPLLFSFVALIAEAQLAAISIAWLGSISNISKVVLDPTILSLTPIFTFNQIYITSLIYQILFILKFADQFQMLQYTPKENFSLNYYTELTDLKFVNDIQKQQQ